MCQSDRAPTPAPANAAAAAGGRTFRARDKKIRLVLDHTPRDPLGLRVRRISAGRPRAGRAHRRAGRRSGQHPARPAAGSARRTAAGPRDRCDLPFWTARLHRRTICRSQMARPWPLCRNNTVREGIWLFAKGACQKRRRLELHLTDSASRPSELRPRPAGQLKFVSPGQYRTRAWRAVVFCDSGRGYATPAARGVGPMNAPMIHRIGKKNPIQNIQ